MSDKEICDLLIRGVNIECGFQAEDQLACLDFVQELGFELGFDVTLEIEARGGRLPWQYVYFDEDDEVIHMKNWLDSNEEAIDLSDLIAERFNEIPQLQFDDLYNEILCQIGVVQC